MAPRNIITIKCDQVSCNLSDIIVIGLVNATSGSRDEESETYDSMGAVKFITTTLLVYSLMGISGMLFLRIRRGTRTHRVVTVREESLQQYIKHVDDLKMAGHRHKLKVATSRMVHHLQNIERQKSFIGSSSDQSSPLLDPTQMIGQHIQFLHSLESHPITLSPSGLRELSSLPFLKEEYTEITVHEKARPVVCDSSCTVCGTTSCDSFDEGMSHAVLDTSAQTPTSSVVTGDVSGSRIEDTDLSAGSKSYFDEGLMAVITKGRKAGTVVTL